MRAGRVRLVAGHLHMLDQTVPGRRADALLREHLTPWQRDDLDRDGAFVVAGSDGRPYVINRYDTFGVIDVTRGMVRGYHAIDVYSGGHPPLGDSLLALKLAVETNVAHMHKVACILGSRPSPAENDGCPTCRRWTLADALVAGQRERPYRGPGFERRWFGRRP